jgi:hypothetical protein
MIKKEFLKETDSMKKLKQLSILHASYDDLKTFYNYVSHNIARGAKLLSVKYLADSGKSV